MYYKKERDNETTEEIIKRAIDALHDGKDEQVNIILLNGLGIHTRNIAKVIDIMGGNISTIASSIDEKTKAIMEKYGIEENGKIKDTGLIELRAGKVIDQIEALKNRPKEKTREYVIVNSGIISGAVDLDWTRQLPDTKLEEFLTDLGNVYHDTVKNYVDRYNVLDAINQVRASSFVRKNGIGAIVSFLSPEELKSLNDNLETIKTKIQHRTINASEIAEADKSNEISDKDMKNVAKVITPPSKNGEVI